MTALDADHVSAALTSKLGCKQDSTDHYRYVLYDDDDDDGKILATTKLSHGAKHSIGATLIMLMARQMKLGTSSNSVGLVRCSKSREECLTIIRAASAQSRF